MALKVEVSKLFQCGISSGKSNHFCRDVPKCKSFRGTRKVFSRGIGCFVTHCRKGFRTISNLCIDFVWRINIGESAYTSKTIKVYFSQRIAESRGFSLGTPVLLKKFKNSLTTILKKTKNSWFQLTACF